MKCDSPVVSAIVIGARKTGTTWLYENFKLSNRIVVPTEMKETGFFLPHSPLKKCDYHSLFKRSEVDSVVFVEVDTSLLDSEGAPARIKAYNQKMKIVVVTRDVHELASSRFIQGKRKGVFAHKSLWKELNENKSFRNELRLEAQVNRYATYFPAHQIYRADYRTLQNDPRRFYSEIFRFITGVEPDHNVSTAIVNSAREARFSFIFVLGVSLGKLLRRHRFYWVANFLKSVANTFLFQKKSDGMSLSSEEIALINKIASSELE